MAKATRRAGAVVIAVMLLGGVRPAIAGEGVRTVAVRVDDSHGVPASVLRASQEEASRIYAAIGVSLVWLDGRVDLRRVPDDAVRLDVSLLSEVRTQDFLRRARLPKTVLGVAPHDTGRAYIFCGRILRRALSTGEIFETILGRVLAHEIGHHMLPRRGHSEGGIMAASLNYRSEEAPAFTDAQADSIRTLIMASR